MEKANKEKNNINDIKDLQKDGDTMEIIKNIEETSQSKGDDVAHDVETYLTMWHDDMGMHNYVEPCKKSNTCGINILS